MVQQEDILEDPVDILNQRDDSLILELSCLKCQDFLETLPEQIAGYHPYCLRCRVCQKIERYDESHPNLFSQIHKSCSLCLICQKGKILFESQIIYPDPISMIHDCC